MSVATAGFRGASRASLAELTARLGAGSGGVELGAQLFAVADLLDRHPTLRRAVTDPARSVDDRAGLLVGLLGDHLGAGAVELADAAVRLSWSRVRDLSDALEYLGVLAEVVAAEQAGGLDELEDELFRFGRIVAGDADLRATLGDSSVPADRRADLAAELLSGRAGEPTIRLVRQALQAPRGQTLLDSLESYAQIAAAWRERLVAVVRTAVTLDTAQTDRLQALLSRRYGRQIQLNIAVDPDVLGGIRIEIGDQVIDGTVVARLDAARRKLAG